MATKRVVWRVAVERWVGCMRCRRIADDMNVNQYFSRLIPSASDAGTAQADYYLTRPGLWDLGVLFNSDP